MSLPEVGRVKHKYGTFWSIIICFLVTLSRPLLVWILLQELCEKQEAKK